MTVVDARSKIADRYELIERVAVGGMGEVWRSLDTLLRRPVAVKVLRSEYANDPQFAQNLRQEARASAGVAHPNVAWVFDYGEEGAPGDDGARFAYVVMEFVEGESLGSLLARRRRLTATQTLEVVAQVAEALKVAHGRHLVHRDIKPGNLLVRPDGVVKITDFGIAHAADVAPAVPSGTAFGSIPYISPEQAMGRPTTAASDLYSLGVVAYECLSGRSLFSDPDPESLARAHIEQPPAPLPDDVPAPVAGFVMRLLAKQPRRRPPSARAVAEEAVSWLAYLDEGETLADAMGGWTALPSLNGDEPPTGAVPPVGRVDDHTGVVPPVPAGDGHSPHLAPTGALAPLQADVAATGRIWADTSMFRPVTRHLRARRWRRRRRLALRAGVVLVLLAVVATAALLFADRPSSASSQVTVPALHGEALATAQRTLAAMGLRSMVRIVDKPGSARHVVAQHPASGVDVRRHARVLLDVASGFISLPRSSLVGRPYVQVEKELRWMGFTVTKRLVQAPGVAVGHVADVTPTGRVPEHAALIVSVVAPPPPPTTVPPTTAPPPGPPATTVPAPAPPPTTPAPAPAPASAPAPTPTTAAPAPSTTSTTTAPASGAKPSSPSPKR